MFEDKRITKEKINNILYSVYNEFNNEIIDIEEISDSYGEEIEEEEIDFSLWLLRRYIDKIQLVIEDEVEDI